ncbi:hypothetical protein PI124_g3558 [Phytophthora idaei]|nr:hypothetical protein PI124_g3558 [Phytophthora idaei]
MRLSFLLFIFLVGFNACSSFYLNAKQFEDPDHINTEPLSGPRFFTGNKNSALSKRGLRSYDGPKKNKNNIDDKIKEERAGIPGLSMLDDLGYKLALDRKMNPADIFPRLGFVNAGELVGNPRFIRYLQYVIKFREIAQGSSCSRTTSYLTCCGTRRNRKHTW